MIYINNDKALQNAEKLREKTSSSEVFRNALRKILYPNKKNIIRKIIFLFIEIMIGTIIACQMDTIELTRQVIDVFITILLALIAIVFTGYAFFQALVNDKMLVALLSVDSEEGNLIGSNKYFTEVMIFQVGCLLLDMLIMIFMITLPQYWNLFNNAYLNVVLSIILLTSVFIVM